MSSCRGCGATFRDGETSCTWCGTPLAGGARERPAQENRGRNNNGGFADAFREGYRGKNPSNGGAGSQYARQGSDGSPPPLTIFRTPRFDLLIAAILAITLGTFGAHCFYLGEPRRGIRRALFFWTGVPTIMGLIDGAGFLLDLIRGC
ncbi:MAG: TM2 domain-containing protein [Oscillospiraceae bacterium]|jgi:hypothetical protein|nr:TM2 domain-containing protein [Oscillospiraceae bacterium]